MSEANESGHAGAGLVWSVHVKGYQMPAGDVGSDGHARLIGVQEAGV